MFYCHICVAVFPPAPCVCCMIYRKVSLQFNVALVLFSLVNDYCACRIFTLCVAGFSGRWKQKTKIASRPITSSIFWTGLQEMYLSVIHLYLELK